MAVYAVWNNRATLSVSDNKQNSYARPSTSTRWGHGHSAQVLFAKNLRGGESAVTVTFSRSVNASLYVSEYSGVDTVNPLDGSRARAGSGSILSSGPVQTTKSGDLLFGAGAAGNDITNGGTGFAVRSTAYGNLTEDRLLGSAASYTASARHTRGSWVMQAVAFKAATAPATQTTTAQGGGSSSGSSTASSSGVSTSSAPHTSSATSSAATSTHSSTTPPTSSTSKSTASSSSSSAASTSTSSSPASGGGTQCAYPTPKCTGVPAGTTFTKTVNGDYTAKTPGENIDRWHITGSLMIAAGNVTVTNTEIDGAVDNEIGTTKYGPFSITDSTIGPASGCVIAPGLGESQYTAKRVLIRGHDDGFRMSADNINISDSFAQLCAQPSSHSDGIQAYCPSGPCQNVVFNHNTIDADKVPSTYALNLVDPNLSSVQATGNLLLGGAYVVDAHWHSGSTWTISNNRIVDKAWTYGPVTTESTCSHQSWSGNTLVTIDSSYNVTGTVGPQPCVQ